MAYREGIRPEHGMDNLKESELPLGCFIYRAALSPAQVAATTTASEAFTVTGIRTTDLIVVIKPTEQTGLAVTKARASAANTITLEFSNLTAATAITPTAAEEYVFLVFRPMVYANQ